MFFVFISCIIFILGFCSFFILHNISRIGRIIVPLLCLFLAMVFFFISAMFPPKPIPDNIIYLTECTISPKENGEIVTSSGSTTIFNFYTFFENFDFGPCASEKIRIIESADYDEITLQLYTYKDNFWYSSFFARSYLFVLIIPAKQ